MHIGTTLTNYIIETQRNLPEATGEFTGLLNDISVACKRIADLVNKGDLVGMLGSADSENVQGETQKKLDVVTNEVFIEALTQNGHIAGLVSEEMDDIYPLPNPSQRGRYLLLCDPLDGSSNIDVNVSVGTIFSIVRAPQGSEKPSTGDFLQRGTEQVAAGYCLYGPSTILVLAVKGQGVQMFTLNRDFGEFILTRKDVQIPEDTKEFAINVSNQRHWEEPVQRYIDECLQGKEGPRGKDFNMRWVASMVAEVHRILCRGGVFMYPLDAKIKAKGQSGRLRLMYEANPMSLIVEQAGGAATTGRQRILELDPTDIHERAPVVLGSKNEVEQVTSYHREG
ncbi:MULTISPECIES: class 1 fructose-bisphosphatase [Halorhodospira]|uniref:class 1 fructose-bisphosphatase n=1 Tax=Halorhodospira TaxID=85108 RepID=UPI001914C1D8|nr:MULTISPECIES: class 1 fructose-bisphosphatase [Halorhodospira]MBK5944629.1 fructose-bisphosphatase class I [Halorhodospira halophila]MCG5527228.1 class 1 fructose-bisphosphatase [Halorhodospira halophila]MCG5540628.1 class 1 fructose-bisphosphatase [Halorhodospira sp. M39old]MCG5543428.1 class 1 fructose-bisphosphatase [Halorhodospira sp. 9628]MCG5546749.1 class 1 fructose-bisphosphatase [Halorhodospira sp. M38]